MSDVRADIIRVLHRAYVDNGWVPPTLDGYADALVAAGYGKVDSEAGKVRAAVLAVLDDPGGPDSWSHTFQGRQSVFADDVRAALTEPSL